MNSIQNQNSVLSLAPTSRVIAAQVASKESLHCGMSGIVKVTASATEQVTCGVPIFIPERGMMMTPLCEKDMFKCNLVLSTLSGVKDMSAAQSKQSQCVAVDMRAASGTPASAEQITVRTSECGDSLQQETPLLAPLDVAGQEASPSSKCSWGERFSRLSMPAKVGLGVAAGVITLGTLAGAVAGGLSHGSSSVDKMMKLRIQKPENCEHDIKIYQGNYIAHTIDKAECDTALPCALHFEYDIPAGKQTTVTFSPTKSYTHTFNPELPCVTFSESNAPVEKASCSNSIKFCRNPIPLMCDSYAIEFDLSKSCHHLLIPNDAELSIGKNITWIGQWTKQKNSNQKRCHDSSLIQKYPEFFSTNSEISMELSAAVKGLTGEYEIPKNASQKHTYSLFDGNLRFSLECDSNPDIVFKPVLTGTGSCDIADGYEEVCNS